MRTFVLIAVVLSVCALPCSAADPSSLLPQAKAAFKRFAPGLHFQAESTVFGDVNGDGMTDFVAFAEDAERNENGETGAKIAVFLGAADHTFSFYEASAKLEGNERVTQELSIKAQSIFLQRDGANGVSAHWLEVAQFKMREAHLMLVGLTLENAHVGDSTNADRGSSVNLITGQSIRWLGTGKHRKAKSVRVASIKPVPFKELDYDKFMDKWRNVLW